MTKPLLYLDPFSGIAGDMLVGALLDLGLDFAHLQGELAKLKLDGYRLEHKKVKRGGIAASKFEVLLENGGAREAEDGDQEEALHAHHGHEHSHGHPASAAKPHEPSARSHEPGATSQEPHFHAHRPFREIRALIEGSALSERVKAQSLRAFSLLAEAEGRVHGQAPEMVAFHEVGAVDSIVDFVGACIGLEALGITEVRCGPLALGGEGGGYVDCAHGKLPLPAFATLELLQGVPLRPCPVNKELTTPTGAALVRALVQAHHFGPLPPMRIEKIGYGAGTRNDPALPVPNVLRAVLGTLAADASMEEADTIVEIQANLDDASPEVLGYLAEKLLKQDALDVFFTPVSMKKSRPGTLLTVLAPPGAFDSVAATLFRETPTFGLRYETKTRAKLAREMKTVQTPWGPVRVKLGRWRGELVSAHPEYEDGKALAEQHGVPLHIVLDAARSAAEAEGERQE